jgi:hypothetical protein
MHEVEEDLFVLKYIACSELRVDDDFEIIADEVKGSDLNTRGQS